MVTVGEEILIMSQPPERNGSLPLEEIPDIELGKGDPSEAPLNVEDKEESTSLVKVEVDPSSEETDITTPPQEVQDEEAAQRPQRERPLTERGFDYYMSIARKNHAAAANKVRRIISQCNELMKEDVPDVTKLSKWRIALQSECHQLEALCRKVMALAHCEDSPEAYCLDEGSCRHGPDDGQPVGYSVQSATDASP